MFVCVPRAVRTREKVEIKRKKFITTCGLIIICFPSGTLRICKVKQAPEEHNKPAKPECKHKRDLRGESARRARADSYLLAAAVAGVAISRNEGN